MWWAQFVKYQRETLNIRFLLWTKDTMGECAYVHSRFTSFPPEIRRASMRIVFHVPRTRVSSNRRKLFARFINFPLWFQGMYLWEGGLTLSNKQCFVLIYFLILWRRLYTIRANFASSIGLLSPPRLYARGWTIHEVVYYRKREIVEKIYNTEDAFAFCLEKVEIKFL